MKLAHSIEKIKKITNILNYENIKYIIRENFIYKNTRGIAKGKR